MTDLPLILLAAATLADHATTVYFLRHRTGLKEGNPLLRALEQRWGTTPIFLAKLGMLAAVAALHHHGQLGAHPDRWILGLAALFALVAARNVYMIVQAGRAKAG